MTLGLIPDGNLGHVTSAGNVARTGVRIALLSRKARRKTEAVVSRVEKLETATEPRFQKHFVGTRAIPHNVEPFPLRHQRVELPAPAASDSTLGRGTGCHRRREERAANPYWVPPPGSGELARQPSIDLAAGALPPPMAPAGWETPGARIAYTCGAQ